MHYANGRAANIGDVVRGKGYNIKHEITGLLLSANPAATACNCTIATVSVNSQVKALGWRDNKTGDFAFQNSDGRVFVGEVVATLEYGQLDAFLALNPDTGEVLPPVGKDHPDAYKSPEQIIAEQGL